MGSKQKDLSAIYNDIKLTMDQKKQLHFMLLRIQNLTDIKALSNISYNEIEEVRCCNDALCVCGSSVKPLKLRLQEEAAKDKPMTVFQEIKAKTRGVVHFSDKLTRLKEAAGEEFEHFDENRRIETDLRAELFTYKNKIKDIIFELHLSSQ